MKSGQVVAYPEATIKRLTASPPPTLCLDLLMEELA